MASDAFLKLEGIDGESTDTGHKDWIEITSFSSGVMQTSAGSRSSGGAATGGRCDHTDFTITKELDKTSPKLLLHCCNGKHIKTGTLELFRATGGGSSIKYMEYKMEDLIVSNVSTGGSGSGLPSESVSLNYGKITWTYTALDHQTGASKGNVTANWSVVENKGQ